MCPDEPDSHVKYDYEEVLYRSTIIIQRQTQWRPTAPFDVSLGWNLNNPKDIHLRNTRVDRCCCMPMNGWRWEYGFIIPVTGAGGCRSPITLSLAHSRRSSRERKSLDPGNNTRLGILAKPAIKSTGTLSKSRRQHEDERAEQGDTITMARTIGVFYIARMVGRSKTITIRMIAFLIPWKFTVPQTVFVDMIIRWVSIENWITCKWCWWWLWIGLNSRAVLESQWNNYPYWGGGGKTLHFVFLGIAIHSQWRKRVISFFFYAAIIEWKLLWVDPHRLHDNNRWSGEGG